MKKTTLSHKKKKFMNWFLQTYRLKRPEAVRILECLSENDDLLANTHFVENVRQLPNALIISAEDAVTVSFLCRINDVYYEDIDQIISILMNFPPDDLFVWLSFNREFLCSMCDVPLGLKPEVEEKIFYYKFIRDLEKELNFRIANSSERKEKLMEEIDAALENGDRERFMGLSKLYRELF